MNLSLCVVVTQMSRFPWNFWISVGLLTGWKRHYLRVSIFSGGKLECVYLGINVGIFYQQFFGTFKKKLCQRFSPFKYIEIIVFHNQTLASYGRDFGYCHNHKIHKIRNFPEQIKNMIYRLSHLATWTAYQSVQK